MVGKSRNGWIKAYRDWMTEPAIWKDPDHIAVWMFLQLSATHEERKANFGGKAINLKPGQLITGRDHIAKHTGVNSQKVYRILKKLKSEQLIEQHSCPQGTLISLLFWESEQGNEQQFKQQANNERKKNEHLQEDINENERKVKNNFPSVDDVRLFCTEQGLSVDPVRFVDYYNQRNWQINGRTISDWVKILRAWDEREKKWQAQKEVRINLTTENTQLKEHEEYNYRTNYI